MNKFFRYGLTAIALTFILGAFAATATKAQPTTEILKRMDEHYRALKSLQANIAREKTDSQLGEVDKTSGTLSLLPGSGRNFSMRLDWTVPREETISVVNGQYVLYTPKLKQAYTGSSESKTLNSKGGGALKVISMTKKEELKANYDIQYLGQENISGGIPTWHLKLTPKTKAEFQYADIWVDGNGMPLQVKITQPNNDTDVILLTNLKKNVSISGSIFKVSLPKDTKIIKG